MLNWHVVCASPQQEIRAAIELAKLEFDVFYPVKRYTRRRMNRPPEVVTGPLFPRYIFARFDREGADLSVIKKLRGVSDVLCNGNKPIIVRDEIMAAVRQYQEP